MFAFLLMILSLLLALLFLAGFALLARLTHISGAASSRQPRTQPASTLIILGSGGHTAEMLQIVAALDCRHYRPRHYVCADTDSFSAAAASRLEEERGCVAELDYRIARIIRSRAVHQSYVSSVWSTLRAFFGGALPLVWSVRPDLVLCNGPGTGVPLLVAAYWWRLAGRLPAATKLVFVESFCRVKTVSLTGRLVARLVDLFVVQWEELARVEGRTYLGKLM